MTFDTFVQSDEETWPDQDMTKTLHGFWTLKSDTGQHSQFLRCFLKPLLCVIDFSAQPDRTWVPPSKCFANTWCHQICWQRQPYFNWGVGECCGMQRIQRRPHCLTHHSHGDTWNALSFCKETKPFSFIFLLSDMAEVKLYFGKALHTKRMICQKCGCGFGQ